MLVEMGYGGDACGCTVGFNNVKLYQDVAMSSIIQHCCAEPECLKKLDIISRHRHVMMI